MSGAGSKLPDSSRPFGGTVGSPSYFRPYVICVTCLCSIATQCIPGDARRIVLVLCPANFPTAASEQLATRNGEYRVDLREQVTMLVLDPKQEELV